MALLLRESDVRELLSLPELIGVMEEAVAAYSAHRVQQPVRTMINADNPESILGIMSAYLPSAPALGVKLVTVFKGNALRNIPTHQAHIFLYSPHTGELLAIIDGRYITEVRTAAVSAVSVKKLAHADVSNRCELAIIGSGVQARSHAEILPLVREFTDIRAWSPTSAHLKRFCEEMPKVRATASAEDAIRGADVIVLATNATSPVVLDKWVKPGVHIISLGAYLPEHREMDPKLVTRSRVFVDTRDLALRDSGDLVLGIREGLFNADHIAGELGDPETKRLTADEITIFKSMGMAVEDMAAAHLVYQRALASSGKYATVKL